MSRPSNEERLAKIHAEAIEEFDKIQSAVRDERLQCLQDRRFCDIAGAQWEGALGDQFENKPKFEVNKVHLSALRIENEYLNNRITVNFVSKDGTEDDKLAEVCDGLYRADEQDSQATEAYDNAFKEASKGGMGAWRYRTCYEDEEDPENDYQRIHIEPIYEADTCVFFDLNAKRQDKSDAKSCYVLTSYTPEAYEEEWEDNPVSWPKDIDQREFDWASPDVVFVAEYYRVEHTKDTVVFFEDVQGTEERHLQSELDADEELVATLKATCRKETRRKKINVKAIHKYIMSGGKILEDCGVIAGKNIPIVPTYGQRSFVDSVERCMGHVRLAKDVQRLKNMQLSKLGELSAQSSIEKPILTPEQIAGHQVMWSEDNIKQYPYLLVNPILDANGQQMVAGPIAYTKPPMIPPAMAALLQITETDMQEILGGAQGAEKVVSNIGSKTVEMIHQRLDMQTYIYMSNHAKGIQRGGEIWLSMAKEVYVDPERKMKTVGTHGETGSIELMKPTIDPDTAEKVTENDLTKATFDVVSEVGPSSTSRRDSTIQKLTNMMGATQDPETLQVLGSMVMLNMEGEGISEVRDFFRMKLVKMGVIKPTDEEKAILEAQQKGEDPNATYLKAAADEATANATQARVKTLETMASADLKRAQTEETKAKTVETMAGVSGGMAQAAQAIEQVGAQNSIGGQDTSLAHVNEQEKDMMRRMGGSGRVDPVTGIEHFDAGGKRGDSNAGNASGGYGGGDNDGDGGNSGGGTGRTSKTGTSNPENTSNYGAATRDSGGDDYSASANPSVMSLDNVPLRGATPGYAASVPSEITKGSIGRGVLGAGLGYLFGGPSLAAKGAQIGYRSGAGQTVSGLGNTAGYNATGKGAIGSSRGLAGGPEGRDGDGSSSLLGVNTPTASSQIAATTTPAAEDAYQAVVPVEEWSSLSVADRQKAMREFWAQF